MSSNRIGKLGIVDYVDDITEGRIYVKWDDGKGPDGPYYDWRFEKVEAKKFSVGDKVRVKDAFKDWDGYEGFIVTPTQPVTENRYQLDNGWFNLREDQLELVEPVEPTDQELADAYRSAFAIAQQALEGLQKRGYMVGPLQLSKTSEIKIQKSELKVTNL